MHVNHRMRPSDDRRRPEMPALCGLCLLQKRSRARVKNGANDAHAATPGRTFT